MIASENLPRRLFVSLVFAFLFASIGIAVPTFYYKHMDDRQYVIVDSPVNVDKNYYKPCESTVLTTQLAALLDVDALILNQLVLVNNKGEQFQVLSSLYEIRTPIQKQELHQVSSPYTLPCDLKDGRYFWRGTITYKILGFEKTTGFISQTFFVTKSGLSPAAEELLKEEK